MDNSKKQHAKDKEFYYHEDYNLTKRSPPPRDDLKMALRKRKKLPTNVKNLCPYETSDPEKYEPLRVKKCSSHQ